MPTAILDTSGLTAGDEVGDTIRHLIPGVEPGGSRAGRAFKPALLIVDCRASLQNLADAGVAADFQTSSVFLKLSQELDLTPGLELRIADATLGKTATANLWNSIQVQQQFRAQGKIFAPRVVGLFVELGSGGIDTLDWVVELEYERIDIPWMDWLLQWEYLDGIVDNEREY